MRLSFDDYELETDTYSLQRADKGLRVEPRVFELLAFLLRERHRLITKDELIEVVWHGQVVSDTALSRCVYMARQALGDDSNRQRYIKTVHGRGYRWNDAVAVNEHTENLPSEAPHREAPNREAPNREAPDPIPATPEPAAGDARALSTRHGRAWPRLAILASVALVAALAAWRQHSQTAATPEPATTNSIPAGEPSGRAGPVGVAWHVVSEHSEATLTAMSLSDLVIRRLEEIDGLAVRAILGDDSAPLLDRNSLARVFDETGSKLLLVGQVADIGGEDRFVASAELYQLDGTTLIGSPLGRFELPRLRDAGDLDVFLQVRESVATRLVHSLGLLADLADDDPMAPTNVDAYRLFLLAQDAIMTDFCASTTAVGLLERSLELDPEFVLAWEMLAVAHYNLGWACGLDPSALDAFHAAADEVVRRAPERPPIHLLRMDLLAETGQVEEAWAQRIASTFLDPEEPLVIASEIYVLTFAGFLEEARSRIVRLTEREPVYYSHGQAGESPNALLYLGDFATFERTLPFLDTAYHRYYQGFAAVLRGDLAAAQATLEPAFRTSPGSVFGRLAQGLLAAIEGDLAGARTIIEQLARQRRELESVDAEITYKQAQILALAGDRAGALDNLEQTVDGGFFAYRAIRDDPTLTALAGDPRFDALLERARARHLAFAERFSLAPDIGSGGAPLKD